MLKKVSEKNINYIIVGNPNSGKTTIFNQLTSSREKVANHSGVTIEQKKGFCFSQHGKMMNIIDTPGLYSLNSKSLDESILKDIIFENCLQASTLNRLICVVDASKIESQLYLVSQLIELGIPMILVLNMIDQAKNEGKIINHSYLEKTLGIPVVITEAHKNKGIISLKVIMSRSKLSQPNWIIDLPEPIAKAVLKIQSKLVENIAYEINIRLARGKALMMLSNNDENNFSIITECKKNLNIILPSWKTIIIESRYNNINNLIHNTLTFEKGIKFCWTKKIDDFVLHPILGWIIFSIIMSITFLGIFTLAEYPKNLIEKFFRLISLYLDQILLEGPVKRLIIDGIITGVGNIIIFLPQIIVLFLIMGLLESSGYLPRASFLLEKIMSRVGLQGSSFVPLLTSFGCAIPGILATRSVSSAKSRLITILIAPWMSCSARLPIYILMIDSLFTKEQSSMFLKSLILFLIYFIGILIAFIFAFIFKKTISDEKKEPSLIILPSYKFPSIKKIFIDIFDNTLFFLKNAGTVIMPISILFWFLVAYPNSNFNKTLNEQQHITQSYAGQIGRIIEPIIKPLGFDWKIGVGLITSFFSRETFVSTMSILNYNGHIENKFNRSYQLEMHYSRLTSISVIIFFIYAMQCFSTLAIVKKETKTFKWPIFQFFFMTSFAYISSLIFYQSGMFYQKIINL